MPARRTFDQCERVRHRERFTEHTGIGVSGHRGWCLGELDKPTYPLLGVGMRTQNRRRRNLPSRSQDAVEKTLLVPLHLPERGSKAHSISGKLQSSHVGIELTGSGESQLEHGQHRRCSE